MKRFVSVVALISATTIVLLSGQGVANAQPDPAGPKQPVIDSAPAKVRFRAHPTISGHLENGAPGDEVALQRRRGGSEWKTIARTGVDEESKVSYGLAEVRRTATYRLTYVDPVTGTETYSEEHVIRVAPRLTLNVTPSHVMKGREVTVSGRLYPVAADRSVAIQIRRDGRWRSLGTAYVRDGQFALRVTAYRRGYRRLRAVFRGDGLNTAKKRVTGMRVYARALATWYGPGFYGNGTACGKRLSRDTLGVAHRWLPCGTMVAVLYEGRTVMVPVIDRGPYSRADWDLTQRTAERLRFGGTDTIGVDPDR